MSVLLRLVMIWTSVPVFSLTAFTAESPAMYHFLCGCRYGTREESCQNFRTILIVTIFLIEKNSGPEESSHESESRQSF